MKDVTFSRIIVNDDTHLCEIKENNEVLLSSECPANESVLLQYLDFEILFAPESVEKGEEYIFINVKSLRKHVE
jgi:hypothetical protein